MTKRLYYNDPTLIEFEATIVEIGQSTDRFYTVLDKTAFYPTSGGQMHDLGDLNRVSVVDVEEENSIIRHITTVPVGQVGEKVNGKIDESRRFANRQQHSAQHILSQAFYRQFGLVTQSVHLGESYGNIEFDTKEISHEAVDQIETTSNQIIAQNRPVLIHEVDSSELDTYPLRKKTTRSGKIRLIQIDDFDCVACGGTHVTSTGEIQLIKIIGVEKIRGRVAVKFLCGNQALHDYKSRFDMTTALTKELTCGIDEIPVRFINLTSDNKRLKSELTIAQKELLPIKADELIVENKTYGNVRTLLKEVDNIDDKLLAPLATLCAEKINGLVLLRQGSRIIITSDTGVKFYSNEVAKYLAEQFSLKGGGSKTLAQLGGAEKLRFQKIKDSIIEYITHE